MIDPFVASLWKAASQTEILDQQGLIETCNGDLAFGFDDDNRSSYSGTYSDYSDYDDYSYSYSYSDDNGSKSDTDITDTQVDGKDVRYKHAMSLAMKIPPADPATQLGGDIDSDELDTPNPKQKKLSPSPGKPKAKPKGKTKGKAKPTVKPKDAKPVKPAHKDDETPTKLPQKRPMSEAGKQWFTFLQGKMKDPAYHPDLKFRDRMKRAGDEWQEKFLVNSNGKVFGCSKCRFGRGGCGICNPAKSKNL